MGSDSKWGDPRESQIEAFLSGAWVTEKVQAPEMRVLGFVVKEAGEKTVKFYVQNLSTKNGGVIPDDTEAYRKFRHRCGLIKAINVLAGSKSTLTLYLDGFPNMAIEIGLSEFKFNSQLEDGPVVEIFYGGYCTRRGEMQYGRTDIFSVALIFKDQAQMKEFVVATAVTPDPEQKTAYRDSGYRSSDSGSSLWPLAAGVLLGVAIGGSD